MNIYSTSIFSIFFGLSTNCKTDSRDYFWAFIKIRHTRPSDTKKKYCSPYFFVIRIILCNIWLHSLIIFNFINGLLPSKILSNTHERIAFNTFQLSFSVVVVIVVVVPVSRLSNRSDLIILTKKEYDNCLLCLNEILLLCRMAVWFTLFETKKNENIEFTILQMCRASWTWYSWLISSIDIKEILRIWLT